jgi:ammonium transporter, Amt family
VLGFCSGIVAGLVVITPAAGFVTSGGAMLIGLLAGIIPYFAVAKLKNIFGYDDALDTFGVHGVGGTLGAIMTGILANGSVNSVVTDVQGRLNGGSILMEQFKAIGVTIILSVVGTAVIALIVKAILGLRPDEEVETVGLDLAEHGEEGYHTA